MKTFLRINFSDCFPHRLQHFSQCNRTNPISVIGFGVLFWTQRPQQRSMGDSKIWTALHIQCSWWLQFVCARSAHLTVIREHMWVLMVTALNSSYYCYYCQVSSTRTRHRHLVWLLPHSRHTHTHSGSQPTTDAARTMKCNFNLFVLCRTILLICSWYAWPFASLLFVCTRFVQICQTNYRMLLPPPPRMPQV